MNSFNKEQKNILIVDDNESLRNIIKSFLKNVLNVTFFEAENGLQALEIYRKNGIDLILLDIKMPIMDGIQFLEAINKDKKVENNKTKIIVMSGLLNDDIINKTKNMGVAKYIEKPFKALNLKESIKKYI
jgi:CheY-like chemotaxis protein